MAQRGRPRHPGLLTEREQDVLALLREELANEQIADRLGISFETAKHHVSQILSKLGVATRDEAAAWQPEREPSRWTAGRIALALGGTAVFAAAVAGLGLLAWGVSESGDADEVDLIAARPAGAVECLRGLDELPAKGDGIKVFTVRDAVCWQDTAGEAAYEIESTVTYYADCEVWEDRGELDLEPVTETVLATSDVTSARIPGTPDLRYTHAKDVAVTVRALGISGEELARGGLSVQRELDYPAMCGSPPPVSGSL